MAEIKTLLLYLTQRRICWIIIGGGGMSLADVQLLE